MTTRRLLFVCTGNTCRSLMAEAIATSHFVPGLEVASAGLRPQPKEDARFAVQALKQALSIDASHHVPQGLDRVDLSRFDTVVAMDGWVAKRLPDIANVQVIAWDVDDPWSADADPMKYRRTALIIEQKVRKLLADIQEDQTDAA